MKSACHLVFAGCAVAMCSLSVAQTYPSKPVRLVVAKPVGTVRHLVDGGRLEVVLVDRLCLGGAKRRGDKQREGGHEGGGAGHVRVALTVDAEVMLDACSRIR